MIAVAISIINIFLKMKKQIISLADLKGKNMQMAMSGSPNSKMSTNLPKSVPKTMGEGGHQQSGLPNAYMANSQMQNKMMNMNVSGSPQNINIRNVRS